MTTLRRPGDPRRVALGADPARFELKQELIAYSRKLGARSRGPRDERARSVDSADYAEAVGRAITGKGYRQGTRPGAGPARSWRPLHFPGAPPPTTQDPLESPLHSDYEGNSEP